MTTDRQLAANRANAQKSTGLRTAQGKAISSRDNTRHGFRAINPVIPRLESVEAWEQHCTNTIYSLAPANPVEETLAERVALILWRLDRVARYERDVTTQSQDRAPADLANANDQHDADADDADRDLVAVRGRYNEARRRARVLASLDARPADAHITGRDALSALDAVGDQIPNFDIAAFSAPELVPDHVEFDDVPDWTVDRLLRFIAAVATTNSRDPAELRALAIAEARQQLNAERATCRRLVRQVRDLRRQRILPEKGNLSHLVQYEAHLMRQLSQTLGHLKQLQQQRETSRRRRAPAFDDYHDYHDSYDTHTSGTPSAAPPDGSSPIPSDESDTEAVPHLLPLSSQERGLGAVGEGGPMVGMIEVYHSNPTTPPIPPGQPEDPTDAASLCATPAPDCATPDLDCASPDHPAPTQAHTRDEDAPGSLDNHWG